MQLTEIGQIVETEWLKTPELRPDMHLTLGEFIVMPNHFHAILIIGENEHNKNKTRFAHNYFGPQSKNLASIIHGFKSAVTTQVRKIGNNHFAWQARFHDHIIREQQAYRRISAYIRNNPLQWKEDRFYR